MTPRLVAPLAAGLLAATAATAAAQPTPECVRRYAAHLRQIAAEAVLTGEVDQAYTEFATAQFVRCVTIED